MSVNSEGKTKKQVILEAAAQLFRVRGYSATSMRDLARAVNLKASSLYNHIDSKEEILQEICFVNARRFLTGMRQVEAMEGASAAEKLRALIHLHISVALHDVTSVTAFNDEWRHLSEPSLSRFIDMRRKYEDRFKAVIDEGIREGVFRAADPTIVLYTLLSSVRWLYDWYQPGKRITAREVESQITRILLQGIEVENKENS